MEDRITRLYLQAEKISSFIQIRDGKAEKFVDERKKLHQKFTFQDTFTKGVECDILYLGETMYIRHFSEDGSTYWAFHYKDWCLAKSFVDEKKELMDAFIKHFQSPKIQYWFVTMGTNKPKKVLELERLLKTDGETRVNKEKDIVIQIELTYSFTNKKGKAEDRHTTTYFPFYLQVETKDIEEEYLKFLGKVKENSKSDFKSIMRVLQGFEEKLKSLNVKK